jgi:chitin synthase
MMHAQPMPPPGAMGVGAPPPNRIGPMRQNSQPYAQPMQPMQPLPQQPPMQMMPPTPGITPQPYGYAPSATGIPISPITPTPSNYVQKRTVKNIELTAQGNLVLDIPVPDRVLSLGKITNPSEEFAYVRYTAATCDPDSFPHGGYSLRQQEYQRKTEVFIVVTMVSRLLRTCSIVPSYVKYQQP